MARRRLVAFCTFVSITCLSKGQSAGDIPYYKPNLLQDPDPGDLLQPKKSPAQVQYRVVGGNFAPHGMYPFFTRINRSRIPLCAGALISSEFVLTAAHCNLKVRTTTVAVNGYTRSDDSNPDAIPRNATEILIHPDYDRDSFLYDFALIRLDSPVTEVDPVELNRDITLPREDSPLTVMGMGQTSEFTIGGTPPYLREATIEKRNWAECQQNYQAKGLPKIDDSVQFCASGPEGGVDACTGDSGGPLIDVENDGVLLGLVSFGYGCGRKDFPGVYARVTGALDWIIQNVCRLSRGPKPRMCLATIEAALTSSSSSSSSFSFSSLGAIPSSQRSGRHSPSPTSAPSVPVRSGNSPPSVSASSSSAADAVKLDGMFFETVRESIIQHKHEDEHQLVSEEDETPGKRKRRKDDKAKHRGHEELRNKIKEESRGRLPPPPGKSPHSRDESGSRGGSRHPKGIRGERNPPRKEGRMPPKQGGGGRENPFQSRYDQDEKNDGDSYDIVSDFVFRLQKKLNRRNGGDRARHFLRG